jgi:hypothetical protein
MWCSFFPYPGFTMAIYQVCKAVITSATIISATFFAAGCSDTLNSKTAGASNGDASSTAAKTSGTGHEGHQEGQNSAAGTADAADPANPEDEASKRVSTNHDIYHSKTLEVPAGKPVPAITVQVDPDTVRGWNMYVGIANFTFTPEDVGGESSPSEGHAHLYINEKPMQRIYSSWTHLPELPPGKNTIRVTLNANGHETLTTQNKPIQESVTVEVYDPKAAQN